jgi:hypothetical protein
MAFTPSQFLMIYHSILWCFAFQMSATNHLARAFRPAFGSASKGRLSALRVAQQRALSTGGAASPACVSSGISSLGITNPTTVHKNLPYEKLREHEEANKEGVVTSHGGCFAVDTGIFTGRSPKDKFIVKRPGSTSDKHVWWGAVNQPMEAEAFDELLTDAVEYYNKQERCYVFDGFAGAHPGSRRKVSTRSRG